MLQVREANGYKWVRMVCPKQDFLLVQRLHDFTAEVMSAAGTGDKAGLQRWKLAEYSQR